MFVVFYSILLLQEYTGFLVFTSHPGMRYLNFNDIPRLFTYFLSGMCVYVYRSIIPGTRWLMVLAILALAFSSAIAPLFHAVFPIAGTYLIFYLAYSRKIRLYNFARKGDISYGVYLYAWPLQQLVLYYLRPYISLYLLFGVSLFITLLIAYFWSWKCIEKPFMDLK